MSTLPTTDPYGTDPYVGRTESEEPDPSTRASSTPLMTGGASGVMRILAMIAIAGVIIYGKLQEQPVKINTVFGGLRFPDEIKVSGSRQSILGGGVAPKFGAIAVYVKMKPSQISSKPPAGWETLDYYATHGDINSEIEGFSNVLASLTIDKSLMVQFDGQTQASAFLQDVRASFTAASDGETAMDKVMEALTKSLTESMPAAGAQLYMTCERSRLHVAYGPFVPGLRGVRDTADASTSLRDDVSLHLCTSLFHAFLGAGGVAQQARVGIAEAFSQQYGRNEVVSPLHDEV